MTFNYRRFACRTALVASQFILAIAVFNLLGQGLLANVGALIVVLSLIYVLED